MIATPTQADSFADDLALMQQHFAPIVLRDGARRIVVMAELQGRVIVSILAGDNADSIAQQALGLSLNHIETVFSNAEDTP
ncbi:hypothetical protein R50076_13250 [Gilvimarinus japonicus]|jgi:hypothetical protein